MSDYIRDLEDSIHHVLVMGFRKSSVVLVKKMGDVVPLNGLVECYRKLGMDEQSEWYQSELEALDK